jgi:predicted ATPase
MNGEAVLHYQVLEQMGAGGMGVVFKALDTRLGRYVALKFLPEGARVDPTARARLIAEAQAAARLDHPNIGVIHAIEDGGDLPFIVMALYQGESLRARLDRAPMTVVEAVDLAVQAARGLGVAHHYGVVHRDVKPANLFLSSQGMLKVLDFGLAKLDRMDGLTSAGTVVGTLEYMSPEQIRGQAVDHRTDVWALGVVLYEMLTGVSPFRTEGGMTASILKIIKDEPEPIGALRFDVPVPVAEVLDRALVKDRDQRYGSMAEMLAELQAAQQRGASAVVAVPAPVAAPPTPTAPPAPIAPPSPAPTTQTRPNLPTPASPLVGRVEELAIIAANLDDPNCRILTLFGPGGTGKTRLVVEAARQAIDRGPFADGVYFVALDPLDDAELIPVAIARALGLELRPQEDPLAQVQAAIGERSILIVLDNYEHVMDGAQLPSDLVQNCPGLRILVTSRERLNLEEEWVLPLPGLSLPSAQAATSEEVGRCDSVQLFVQRAKRARMQFSLEDEEPALVGRICRLVAGSPLGIELAASWVKMMGCDEIVKEIETNIDFLASSSRNVTERHRSIRACFEYSWTLLTPKEQDVLGRLTVFQGSFTREAAAAVAGAPLPLLTALIDKSLLQVAGKRFESHPLLRQYAAEKLGERPSARAEAESKHGEFFQSYVQAAHGRPDELTAIDRELSEILTAMQRADARGDGATLVSLMRTLAIDGSYYAARGHTTRSLDVLKAAAAAAASIGEPMTAHILLCKVGNTHRLQRGDPEPALAAYREALAIAEGLRDHHRQAIVLSVIGQTRFEQGADDADTFLERAERIARDHDDALALNHVLQNRGMHAGHRGDMVAAQRLYADALEVIERMPGASSASPTRDYQLFMTLLNLGEPERRLGNLDRSLDLRRRALVLAESRQNELWRAYAIHELAEVHHVMQDRTEAQRLFDEALTLWRRHHVQVKMDALTSFMLAEGYRVRVASGADGPDGGLR